VPVPRIRGHHRHHPRHPGETLTIFELLILLPWFCC
jgi:hypothetical protein